MAGDRDRRVSAERPQAREAGAPRTLAGVVEQVGSAPATDPALARGDALLGRRYRLSRVVGTSQTVLWRGQDVVLARPVAVRVLAAGAPRATGAAMLAAATAAGRLTGTSLASVYDADREDDGTTWVVRAWVDGIPLDSVLRDGALDVTRSAALVGAAAEAVAGIHAAGLAHGALHPGNVLVLAGDQVRLTDAVLAAALRQGAQGATDAGRRDGSQTDARPTADDRADEQLADEQLADVHDLGRLLTACLTARWPAGPRPWRGLPSTPATDGGPPLPRQLRAGLPREVDGVVARALGVQRRGEAPLRSASDMARACADLIALAPVSPPTTTVEPRARRPRVTDRASVRWAIRLAVLLALAAVGYTTGLIIGRVPSPPPSAAGLHPVGTSAPSAAPSVAASPGVALTPVAVTDFDPDGDQSENPALVPNATDGDPSTAWETSLYQSARLGGLKPGVGLLVDLGAVRDVAGVSVGLEGAGTDVSLLAAAADQAAAPTTDAGLQSVATVTAAGATASLRPATAVHTRWVVVWLTSLPAASGGFRGGITELTISSR